MATPILALAQLDSILRDMAKQNAALLELVAYGESVYPTRDEFLQEHRYFVRNVKRALSGTPCFVISAIEHGKELPIFATFDDQDLEQDAPEGDLFRWLQQQCRPTDGTVAKGIGDWLKEHDQERNAEIHILPYLVTKKWGDNLIKIGGVPAALQAVRENRDTLNEFLYTKPVFYARDAPKAIANAYFRAYVCLGVRRQWKDAFEGVDEDRTREKKGDFDALVETLMIFYQMSWGNRSIIDDLEEKRKRERAQQAALTYTLIRGPIEGLVKHLRAAQGPLNRLDAILSPVRGLFASNIVEEKFFTNGPQTFEIRTGPHTIVIRHKYPEFAGNDAEILAAEQIAAVLLSGFGELKDAKPPLWEYLRYALNFNETYRRVAQMLLDRYPELFSSGSSHLKDRKADLGELFDLAKYWFYRAGRYEEPMRLDYLSAGLRLLLPPGTNISVTSEGSEKVDYFWIASDMPVDTVSGLEELCREFGELTAAALTLKPGEIQTATLMLTFAGSAKNIAATKLGEIKDDCNAFKEGRSVTRGNMVFAMMQIFGDEPEWNKDDAGDESKKADKRVFWLRKGAGRVSVAFGGPEADAARITLEWVGRRPLK